MQTITLTLWSEDAGLEYQVMEWAHANPELRWLGAHREGTTLPAKADVVLLDDLLLARADLEPLEFLRRFHPTSRVIVLTEVYDSFARALQLSGHIADVFPRKRITTMPVARVRAGLTSGAAAIPPAASSGSERDGFARVPLDAKRLLRDAPAPAFSVGPDGRALFANDAVARLTGYTVDELMRQDWWRTLFPGEAQAQVSELFWQHLREPLFDHEMTLVTKAGALRRVSWNLVPKLDEQGVLVQLTGIGVEITVPGNSYFEALVREMAKTLDVSCVIVSRILPGSPARVRALALWADGELREPVDCLLAGTPCELAMGPGGCWIPHGIQALFPEDGLLAEFDAEGFMGAPLVSAEGEVVGLVTVLDRHPFPAEEPARSMLRIYAGRTAAEMGRLEALQDLAQREEQFRSLIEHVQDVIVQLGPDERIRYISPSVERTLGSPPDHYLGRDLFEFVHPEDAAALRRCQVEATEPAASCTCVVRVSAGPGQWRQMEVIRSAFTTRNGELMQVLNARDISARVSLETQLRQAQRLESIGRLAAGIAHDFNNMLTAIIGYADGAALQLASAHPLQFELGEIVGAGRRAAGLTRQLLAFSRQQVLHPQVLEMNRVASEVLGMLRRVIGEDVELVSELAEDSGCVFADPSQIEQVLLNLAVNARDAMPEGGCATLTTATTTIAGMRARALDVEPGEYVTLTFSDTGSGIDEETRAHVFEPFFTTKEPGKGTGLGLSTVYGIVRQSNGAIEVESTPGAGTTFRIHLPRKHCVQSLFPPAADAPAEHHRSRGETVLVVEDEDAIRSLVTRTLEAAGYEVLAAEAPEVAMGIAADRHIAIDLLLTDAVMPGMPTRRFVELFQRTHPTAPILLMSGYPGESWSWWSEGAASFLPKPFGSLTLLERVRDALRSHRPGATEAHRDAG